MSEWETMCDMYGYSMDDPDALDGILDSVHLQNLRGLVNAFEAGFVSGEEADEEARALGYNSYSDLVGE